MRPVVVAALLIFAACSSGVPGPGGGPNPPPGGSGSDGGASDAGVPDAGLDGGSPDAGETPPVKWRTIAPDAPELRVVGRADWSAQGGPRFSFPGISIRFVLHGDALRVRLADTSRDEYPDGAPKLSSYAVLVDGALHQRIEAQAGAATYEINDLPGGAHEIEIFRETEGWLAEGQFLGLEIPETAALEPVLPADRRIEFVGDSIMTGYGASGASSAPCAFDRNDQNYRHSYATVAARILGAEQRSESASGIGVARNRDGTSKLLAETIYGRILPTDTQLSWAADGWHPQVVVTQFGANDFAGGEVVDETFIEHYLVLLGAIRQEHPSAMIFVTLDSMLSDSWPKNARERSRARALMQQVVERRTAAGDPRVRFAELPQQTDEEIGCDYHPNIAKHQALGQFLAATIKAELGW